MVPPATGDTLAVTFDANGNLGEKFIVPGGAGEETWRV